MGSTKYEIWVDDFQKKVSLEELAQMAMAHDLKVAWYVEKGDKKMVVDFLVTSTDRILDDGTQIVKRAITETLFTEVAEYKRMIVYDHFRNTCSYCDDMEQIKRYEGTYILPVLWYPSEVVEAATEAILKSEGKH